MCVCVCVCVCVCHRALPGERPEAVGGEAAPVDTWSVQATLCRCTAEWQHTRGSHGELDARARLRHATEVLMAGKKGEK